MGGVSAGSSHGRDAAGSVLRLRQRRGPGEDPTVRPGERTREADDHARIRCPRCGWRPSKNDRWSCTCGCIWNTFETRGVCPGCGHAWRDTQCLRCGQWSPHEDWYVPEGGSGPA